MKNMKKIFITLIFLTLPLDAKGEVIELLNQSIAVKADVIKAYSCEQLKDLQDLKALLVHFIKAPTRSQLEVLTVKYKGIFKNTEKELQSAFNKEDYARIDVRRIVHLDNKKATIKVDLYWLQEGLDGIQTFYFDFIKEGGQWLINWMVY